MRKEHATYTNKMQLKNELRIYWCDVITTVHQRPTFKISQSMTASRPLRIPPRQPNERLHGCLPPAAVNAGGVTGSLLSSSAPCIYRLVQLLYRLRSEACGFIGMNGKPRL